MTDEDGGPVWSRNKRRRSGPPVVGFIVTLLALFGALTAVLAIKERSVAEGGAMIDGWITTGWDKAREITGQAGEAADQAVSDTAEAAEDASQALQSE